MHAHETIHGPLARYEKLGVAHAPGMPVTFSPPPQVSNPNMHHGTCVTHVPWCMMGSLINVFLWYRWWGKRSRHSRRMRNPQFYVSGERPMKKAGVIGLRSVHEGKYHVWLGSVRNNCTIYLMHTNLPCYLIRNQIKDYFLSLISCILLSQLTQV